MRPEGGPRRVHSTLKAGQCGTTEAVFTIVIPESNTISQPWGELRSLSVKQSSFLIFLPSFKSWDFEGDQCLHKYPISLTESWLL